MSKPLEESIIYSVIYDRFGRPFNITLADGRRLYADYDYATDETWIEVDENG
jgi:hypothetical protein